MRSQGHYPTGWSLNLNFVLQVIAHQYFARSVAGNQYEQEQNRKYRWWFHLHLISLQPSDCEQPSYTRPTPQ